MTALTFDTHTAIKEMKDSGLAEAHAESIASAVQASMGHLADVATKADLENLATKADLKNLATKADWENLPTKAYLKPIKEEIRAIKAELRAMRAELKADLRYLELSLTVRLGVMMFAVASLAVAAARYL